MKDKNGVIIKHAPHFIEQTTEHGDGCATGKGGLCDCGAAGVMVDDYGLRPNCVNPDCNCVMRCEAEVLPHGVRVPELWPKVTPTPEQRDAIKDALRSPGTKRK